MEIKTVYAYMYIVVMVIGILALSYQLIEYRNTRRKSYNMFRQMGMTKAGIRKMYITENAFILIPQELLVFCLHWQQDTLQDRHLKPSPVMNSTGRIWKLLLKVLVLL